MADHNPVQLHFYHSGNKYYIGIKKNINTLDQIDSLFAAAVLDFPELSKEKVFFVSTKDNDPFVVGISFEAEGEIPEKYVEFRFTIKTI